MWIPAFAGKTVVHSHIKGSLDDWSQGRYQKTSPYRRHTRTNGFGLFHRRLPGFFTIFRFSFPCWVSYCFYIQNESGGHSFRSLVKHSLVDRSLLYDRHMGGDVGDRVLDGLGDTQRDFSIWRASRIYEFWFLEPTRLPMGSPPLFRDRFFNSLCFSQFCFLFSLSEMDSVLSITQKTVTRMAHSAKRMAKKTSNRHMVS